jgi:hypothetical protein
VSVISALRAGFAAELAVLLDIPVAASWPDQIAPPCGFLSPPLADNYVERGPNFKEHTVALDLILLVDHDDPATSLAALEALLEVALVNTEADWSLSGVDSPAPTAVAEGGAEYLGCVIHLSKPINL